jgi:membrane protein DedA with SNARE-associated domain
MKKEKNIRRISRGWYFFFGTLVSLEAYYAMLQTWLKYKWGSVLQIPMSDTVRTGVLAALFTILALAVWYRWLTYNKKKQINDNT